MTELGIQITGADRQISGDIFLVSNGRQLYRRYVSSFIQVVFPNVGEVTG